MNNLFFMEPVLKMMSQGGFFRKVFASVLRVCAVLTALGGFCGWVMLWRVISQMRGVAVLAFIVVQMLLVVLLYMVVHATLIRAGDIDGLPDGSFIIMPIMSIYMKLQGEIIACYCFVMAIGGCLMVWCAGGLGFIPFMNNMPFARSYAYGGGYGGGYGGASFIGGIAIFGSLLAMGFFILVIFYLLSELMVVFADIATNTKRLRVIAENNSAGVSPHSAHPSAAAPSANRQSLFCTDCGCVISSNAKFCDNCGTSV